jgi:hypothetical protein
LKNRNLLFAGSEFVVFISMDGGATWRYFINGMPTVAAHDLVIHPRDNDLVAGTHGRGFWVLDDITPLQQLTAEVLTKPAHLFEQRVATIWEDQSRGGARGHLFFAAPNPPYIPPRSAASTVRGRLESGALISFYLKARAERVALTVSDLEGDVVRSLEVSGEPGIRRALWDLRRNPTKEQASQFVERVSRLLERVEQSTAATAEQKKLAAQARAELAAAKGDAQLNSLHERLQEQVPAVNFGQPLRGRAVGPGSYRVRLEAAGAPAVETTLTVRPDPLLADD